MKLLVDTHVVLWAQRDSARLSPTVRTLLGDLGNELVISSVVPWEMSIKEHAGKLDEAIPLLADFPGVVAALGGVRLPVEHEHAILAGRLSWDHKDPFDRMLAAQAMLAGASLVSADVVFDTFPGIARLW